MQELKYDLENLRDNITIDNFQLFELLQQLENIDNKTDIDIYTTFFTIWRVKAALEYGFEGETLAFLNTIKDADYVDIVNLEALTSEDIIERLNKLINEIQ